MVRDEAVLDLQQQLHEKDMKLTEIRLESLSSVHQVEQLRETMNRMKVRGIFDIVLGAIEWELVPWEVPSFKG